MTLANKAAVSWRTLAKIAIMLGNGFNSSKCKTAAKLAMSRIKLLRNKRGLLVKQMRRDVSMLLQSGQEAIARIRVEHVIREQNIMAANEIIELFCELVVVRMPIIAKQRSCPADLKEGISSLIFSAPRCSDIPELQQLCKIFQKKYGEDFVTAAVELHPDCGVNRTLIEKMSVRTPSGEVKLKIMKEIALEYGVDWDAKDTEEELLRPPEKKLEGSSTFVSATSMTLKTAAPVPNEASKRFCEGIQNKNIMQFKDPASAAEAAAESAQRAIAAAQAAAAFLAKENSKTSVGYSRQMLRSQSNINSKTVVKEEMFPANLDDDEKIRRHSSGMPLPRVQSDIKFDNSDGIDSSDCDEEIEMENHTNVSNAPPRRPPPLPEARRRSDISDSSSHPLPEARRRSDISDSSSQNSNSRVHPKLPDYDEISARFEALKHGRGT